MTTIAASTNTTLPEERVYFATNSRETNAATFINAQKANSREGWISPAVMDARFFPEVGTNGVVAEIKLAEGSSTGGSVGEIRSLSHQKCPAPSGRKSGLPSG
jgi:hypothetical protein